MLIEILFADQCVKDTGEYPRLQDDRKAGRDSSGLRSTAIAAEILRRRADGTWPEQPEIVDADLGELRLDSIGFAAPLRAAYRTSGTAGPSGFRPGLP